MEINHRKVDDAFRDQSASIVIFIIVSELFNCIQVKLFYFDAHFVREIFIETPFVKEMCLNKFKVSFCV